MKVLVANRGEVACRILRTLREVGARSVAVYSDVDADAPHVWLADEAHGVGEPRGYLDVDKLIGVARRAGATAVHPGYGFLSQSPAFARACAQAALVFVGPSPEAMAALGDKRAARALAQAAGVPVIPGVSACDEVEQARRAAGEVGYPVLLKAAGGGGGKGMRRVESDADLQDAFDAAKREAQGAFADARLLVEKLIHPARHVEVQILADGVRAVALGERECSLQRRYQKIIEEAPCMAISARTRRALCDSAVALAEKARYASAGTVEFLIGPDGSHYFLEVNTRLQVEHPVTECLLGLDIVAAQLELAAGGALPARTALAAARGHAIEARLNAEAPYDGFLPSTGEVLLLEWPQRPGIRVDAGIVAGSVVTPFYDPLLAKIIAWAPSRELARRRLVQALRETTLLGLHTNQAFLVDVLESPFFRDGETFTTTIEAQRWEPKLPAPAVLAAARDKAARSGGLAAHGVHGVRGGAAGVAGTGDAYSPWATLGRFRMVEGL